jgi:hypothetical protein
MVNHTKVVELIIRVLVALARWISPGLRVDRTQWIIKPNGPVQAAITAIQNQFHTVAEHSTRYGVEAVAAYVPGT